MEPRTALFAFRGALPRALARGDPDMLAVTFAGIDGIDLPDGMDRIEARIEKLGQMFADLHAAGVSEVVFAGALSRPALDPAAFDEKTAQAMQTLAPAMQGGDDALLRAVIGLFEAEGYAVKAPHEVAPLLLVSSNTTWGRADAPPERTDAVRALDILTALSPLDVAQSAVVEAGLVLGIETVQGTDAMLDFVAATPAHLRRGKGVFVKAAKVGQDLRVDMPTIGPGTIEKVAAAGLAGLFIAAGGVIVLEQAKVRALVEELGLFLVAR